MVDIGEGLRKAQREIETRVIDEPDPWGPLEKYVPKEWQNGFMFMGTMYHHYWGKIWNYKHGITRKYLYIDDKGDFYSYRPDPISREPTLSKMYNKGEVFNQVFVGIERMGATRETAYTEEYKRKRDEALVRAGYTVAGVSPEGIKEKHRWGEVEYKGNPGPKALPIVTYRGKRYYVDRRLNELRNVEIPWDIVRPIPEQELSGYVGTETITPKYEHSPIQDAVNLIDELKRARVRKDWTTATDLAKKIYALPPKIKQILPYTEQQLEELCRVPIREYIGTETITPKYETRYAKGIAINIPINMGVSEEQVERELPSYKEIMRRYQNKQNWKSSPTPVETTDPQQAQLVARAFTFYLGGAEITQTDNKLTVTSKGYYHYIGS